MIGKQQAISVGPKAIQQINFTANANLTGDTYMMRIFDFSQGSLRVL